MDRNLDHQHMDHQYRNPRSGQLPECDADHGAVQQRIAGHIVFRDPCTALSLYASDGNALRE